MKQKVFFINAFNGDDYMGSPAAVCQLEHWLDNKKLQSIANMNRLPETAFFKQICDNYYQLRWFTPEIEMDLCGHATLATAFVIFEELGYKNNEVYFKTQSGDLKVTKNGIFYELELPLRIAVKATLHKIIIKGLNIQPMQVWKARDYILLYKSEDEIRNLNPNQGIINQINIDPGGIVVTAAANEKDVDFVSRYFTPQASIFEDPVTGSSHCSLIPFWANRIKKKKFTSIQLSKRKGFILCELKKNSVKLKGKASKENEVNISI